MRPFRFLSERIGSKIILPYVVLVFLLGILATFVVMRLVTTSIEEKFREDLADAGRAANEAMRKMEDDYLNVARQMSFTTGVDAAIEQRDLAQLQQVLAPLQLNARIGYLDVFAADGQQIFALRPQARQTEADRLVDPGAASWPPVQKVLQQQVDELGDKYAGIVRTSWDQDIFYVAGPVRRADGAFVGAIAVGNPLDTVVGRLSQEAVVGVTLYDLRAEPGNPLVTSVSNFGNGIPLVATDVAAVREQGQVVLRPLSLGEDRVVEMIGTLVIRRVPAALLGVSRPVNLIEDTGTRTRDFLIAVFMAVVVGVLIVGTMLARHLTQPIESLVRATDRVRQGNLDIAVSVNRTDETGVLAREFNSMVDGLRERNRARDAFGRYFSDDFYELVREGKLDLGGETRDITIIMSDIRSFTTISEGMVPGDLVAMLNDYFAGQVAAIKRQGGEVDKYMGDAILAKFGAPVWYPDHARRAVLAMLEMRTALEVFNQRRLERGEQPIRIGIGANTGPAVVGNIGSQERMEYTIIGDTVNATQRIEDLTKELQWDLLISDTVYEQVANLVEVGEPHLITLRGRQQQTAIYPLLRLKDSAQVEGLLSAAPAALPRPVAASGA